MALTMRTRPCSKNIVPSKSVCRKLFGEPDHEATRRGLDKEMRRLDAEIKQRWSFDFTKEEPLTGGRYEWEKVEADEVVPEAYALPQLDPVARFLVSRLQVAPTSPPSPSPLPAQHVSTQTTPCPALDSQLAAQRSPTPKLRALKRKQSQITDFFSQTKKTRHQKH